MRTLELKRLYVLSNTKEQASQFSFEPGLNLITGNDNSIGKSTLARLPLWTCGCDFPFDMDWRKLDLHCILEFEVDGNPYAVARSKGTIRLKEGGQGWETYEKISGAFAKRFADIVGFGVLLENKRYKEKMEVPPPAYYFSAFYVDQRRGWVSPWNGFENLQQYAAWQAPTIRFHTGYLNADYFEFSADIASRKGRIAEDTALVDNYMRAIGVMDTFLTPLELPATEQELDTAYGEIGETLVAVKRREQRLLTNLTARHQEREDIKAQLAIAVAAVTELTEDYRFAVESVPDDHLQCPLCGTLHDNSLISRAGLLEDSIQVDAEATRLRKSLEQTEESIRQSERRLAKVRRDLVEFNNKYRKLSKDENVRDILAGLGAQSVKQKAAVVTADATKRMKDNRASIRGLQDKRAKSLDEDRWPVIDEAFRVEMAALCEKLRLTLSLPLDGKTVADYKAISESGGAADAARVQLAYALATYALVKEYGTEAVAPLILDTPNQQDQSPQNYDLILKTIDSMAARSGQVIVCATRAAALKNYEKKANVIELGDNRLFGRNQYQELLPLFTEVLLG